MPCLNCLSTNVKLDKVLQLFVCNNCGLIQVSRIFEHRDTKPVNREMMDLILLCSEFGIEEIEEVKKLLRTSYVYLLKSHYPMAPISVAVLFLYQRMNKRHANIQKYSKFLGVKTKTAKRILARLEEHFNVDTIYTLKEAKELCEKHNFDCYELIEKAAEVITLDKHTIAACVYTGTDLSLRKVADFFVMSIETVSRLSKKILEELN